MATLNTRTTNNAMPIANASFGEKIACRNAAPPTKVFPCLVRAKQRSYPYRRLLLRHLTHPFFSSSIIEIRSKASTHISITVIHQSMIQPVLRLVPGRTYCRSFTHPRIQAHPLKADSQGRSDHLDLFPENPIERKLVFRKEDCQPPNLNKKSSTLTHTSEQGKGSRQPALRYERIRYSDKIAE